MTASATLASPSTPAGVCTTDRVRILLPLALANARLRARSARPRNSVRRRPRAMSPTMMCSWPGSTRRAHARVGVLLRRRRRAAGPLHRRCERERRLPRGRLRWRTGFHEQVAAHHGDEGGTRRADHALPARFAHLPCALQANSRTDSRRRATSSGWLSAKASIQALTTDSATGRTSGLASRALVGPAKSGS